MGLWLYVSYAFGSTWSCPISHGVSLVRTHSGRGSRRNNLDPSSWDWPRFKSTLQAPNRLPAHPLLVSVTGWLQSQFLFLSMPPKNGLFLLFFQCFMVFVGFVFCCCFAWFSDVLFFLPPLLFLLQLTVNILCQGCLCCTRTKQVLSLG